MKTALLTGTLWMSGWCIAAFGAGTPRIQFEQSVFDFGKTSGVASVSGVFKFKNTGDDILSLDPPSPSCGCTVAELKPDKLPPGASGELAFTLNLGLTRATLEKHITVHSNDPKTPETSLTIKADYTPLYEIIPMTITPTLAFGTSEEAQVTTITRTDGKALHLGKFVASKPWITATIDAAPMTNEATARIRVAVRRDGPPRRFNEFVQVYAANETNTPLSSIYVFGQFVGEVSLDPEALYWSVTGATNTPVGPEATPVRRVTIRSAAGQAIELKNPKSTIKGIKVELVPKDPGKVYELIARLDDVPASTMSGNLTVDTSVAAQPTLEVPVIVNVFKP